MPSDDYAHWAAHLAELAPSTTVGREYDVAAAIYRAYDEVRVQVGRWQTHPDATRIPRRL